MNNHDKINDYINTHPKECLRLLLIVVSFVWQSIAAILGITVYFIFKRLFKFKWWQTLSLGLVIAGISFAFQDNNFLSPNFANYIHQGWMANVAFWKQLFSKGIVEGIYSLNMNYVMGLPILFAGILNLIDLIPTNPHEKTLKELKEGVQSDTLEVSDKKIEMALKHLREQDYDGTVLGVSKYSGNYLVIPDRDINQVVLVLGTTGGGKTVTLRRFYQRALAKGYPLIIVDGKPDDSNINGLMKLAEQNGRPFFGFNCGNTLPYDPLANGGYTELKDKIISLKDEWSSDHYRSIAEDYLQATFEVLLKLEINCDLKAVVKYLNYDQLNDLVRATEDQDLIDRVRSLEGYNRSDITGLQAHLNILIHSELGQFFIKNERTFTLSEVIKRQGVAYFSLPALRFPSFSKVLGKLVINDLKAVIDRLGANDRVFTVFDEFSVFAGEQVLNLVNMGRGKGVHAIFGTQGLADLDKVDVTFKSQVLNCANTIICHRLNDKESAETVASWVGTQDAFTVTAQLNLAQGEAGLGSVRRNKEFIVHPDAIKQGLQAGEAFYVTKVGKFRQDKVKIKFT